MRNCFLFNLEILNRISQSNAKLSVCERHSTFNWNNGPHFWAEPCTKFFNIDVFDREGISERKFSFGNKTAQQPQYSHAASDINNSLDLDRLVGCCFGDKTGLCIGAVHSLTEDFSMKT